MLKKYIVTLTLVALLPLALAQESSLSEGFERAALSIGRLQVQGTPPDRTLPAPSLKYLGRLSFQIAPATDLGITPEGRRRIVPFAGGTVVGPLLNGEILPSGGDWQVVLPNGTATIDVRSLIKTDDGAQIYVRGQGYRFGPADVMADLAAGKEVDPHLYTFRMVFSFETSAQRYLWLNRVYALGYAGKSGNVVAIDTYVMN